MAERLVEEGRRPIELTRVSKPRQGDVILADNGALGGAGIESSFFASDEDLKNEIQRAEEAEEGIRELFADGVEQAVDNWLDEHPEATTTVEDGSITLKKVGDGLLSYMLISVPTIEALRILSNASRFVGKLLSTKGYYSEGDGGGAYYLIQEGTCVDDGFLNISIDGGYYAVLQSISILGYIDPRWAGAITDGTTDTSVALQKCIDESNRRHLTPINIAGTYYIGATVNVIGDLCLVGKSYPAPFLGSHPNNPSAASSNPSKIIVATGVTAFNCIGLGQTSTTGARRTNLWIKNIEISGETHSGVFIYINAFGYPSRPSKICECYVHGLTKFLVCEHTDAGASSEGTSLYTVDVCNNYIASVDTVFDVSSQSSRSTIGGLNIHDNTIEQCGAIRLLRLFGSNFITNNLFEGCTENWSISLNRGTLDFSGNYFEQNNHAIAFSSEVGPTVSSVHIDSIYILNSPSLAFSFRNVLVNAYSNFYSFVGLNLNLSKIGLVEFLDSVRASVLSADSMLFFPVTLPLTTSDDAVINMNGTVTYRDVTYKEISSYTQIVYRADLHFEVGDVCAVVFTSLTTANMAITYIDSNGSSSGYGLSGYTLYVRRGINVFIWKPQKTTTTSQGAYVFTTVGTPYCQISNIIIKKLDSTIPILRQLSTLTPNFV